MKILIVGSKKDFCLESFYKEHLDVHPLVESVEICSIHDDFIDKHKRNIINKVLYRLFNRLFLLPFNKRLITVVENHSYDVIWVFKGMEIFPKTLKKVKLISPKSRLINYNADHPFDHFSSGTGNSNVYQSIPFYDFHLSYSKEIIKKFETKGFRNCYWLPFAYKQFKAPDLSMKIQKKVCFIGNPDKNRVDIINVLAQNGIEVDVYGHGWNNLIDSEKIKVYDAVYTDDYVNTAQKYYIQLNVFRPHNYNSHNMRTFEMPALGCVLLSPFSEEHELFFKEKKESYYYKNNDDLVTQIQAIFELGENEINDIRKNAFERSVNSGYSYKDRSNELIRLIMKFNK